MANYKIATIQFLKDKGWLIPSSYNTGKCVTYQEVTTTIPKSGASVTVNSICTATSATYANNQLVCEADITAADPNCEKYGFMDNNWALPYRTSGTGAVATSLLSAGTLSVDSSSSWINLIQAVSADPRYAYICSISENSTGSERSGSISFKNNSGCVFTAHVTQGGEVPPGPGPGPGTVKVNVTIYNNMRTNVDNFEFVTYKSTSSSCSKDVIGWSSGSHINLNQGRNDTTWYLQSDWFDYNICEVRFTNYYATAMANGADICDYGNFEVVIEYAHDSSSGHINITLLPKN